MERKQVARKSYADPHKRQKVVHTDNGDDDAVNEVTSGVISVDDDTNEEVIVKPKSPEKASSVIEIDDDESRDKKCSSVEPESIPQEEETPSSTNDVVPTEKLADTEEPVENGDTNKPVVDGATEVEEEQITPDSTTKITLVEEESVKSTEDPPAVPEEVKTD